MPASAIICEKCGGRGQVYDSRTEFSNHQSGGTVEPGTIHRRRKCPVCGHRWQTVEIHVSRADDYDLEIRNADLTRRLRSVKAAVTEILRHVRES